jgi:hypothetical protein
VILIFSKLMLLQGFVELHLTTPGGKNPPVEFKFLIVIFIISIRGYVWHPPSGYNMHPGPD